MEKSEKINRILEMEWESFQQVQNKGGRASCQDDRETFDIMRSSQFLCWPELLLDSYQKDLEEAAAAGRNLLTEKYARMLEVLAPEEYETAAEMLPVLSGEQKRLSGEITEIQVQWMKEYAQKYPELAKRSRPILQKDAPSGEASFETYLKGELCTCSEATLRIYREYVRDLQESGQNLFLLVMEETLKQYGYSFKSV